MGRKDQLDLLGVALLLVVTALLAFNQVIVKWVNIGLQPVFFAGLRSALAVVFLAGFMWAKGRRPKLTRDLAPQGLSMGAIFALEFLCLFLALDLTTVSRVSIIFYSMPVWLALMAHFGLHGERLTVVKGVGLGLAFLGTGLAIYGGAIGVQSGQGSVAGDLLALVAAVCWAGTAFLARRPKMAAAGAETQLFWMILVSGPILLLVSPLFGPLIRELVPMHLIWLLFQASVVVAGGFVLWLWLLSAYPAATVASFSFLIPVFGISLGWLLLDEQITAQILAAGFLVAVGIILINRRPRATPAKSRAVPKNL
jgi:drug/metabolite transporter (DMT)-like permease